MASFYGEPDPPIPNMVNQIPNMDVDHGLPTIPPPPQDGTVKEKRVSTLYSAKMVNSLVSCAIRLFQLHSTHPL